MRIKESIRMINKQRSDTEKTNLIEKGKKIGIDEIIKFNETINNSLKSKIENNVILLLKVQRLNTKKIIPRVSNTTKCAVCDAEKSRFSKEEEAKGILSSLGLQILLSKVPLLGDILFSLYKMNVVSKLLLAGDKFMPEMHLKQPVFTYSACGPFTKNKERIQKFKEIGDTKYIYRNESDKACFLHGLMEILKIQQEEQLLINF